jgi:predicted transcriptional regulator
MAVATKPVSSIAFLQAKAAQLRIDSVRSTTEAGSGQLHQLLEAFGMSADHIAPKVRSVVQAGNRGENA